MAEPRVLVVDCSRRSDDPGQARYRKLTHAEVAQRKRDRAEGEAARRRNAYLSLRLVRDHLLRVTDHLESDARWGKWRQKLRDLPATTADPERVRWPKPPAVTSCLADCRVLWPRLDWSPLTEGSGK